MKINFSFEISTSELVELQNEPTFQKFFQMYMSNVNNMNITKEEITNDSLVMSALHGNLEEVVNLIKSGADINAQNKDGWTALMAASYGGHTNIVAYLLGAGADVDIKDNNGRKAKHLASTRDHKDVLLLLFGKK